MALRTIWPPLAPAEPETLSETAAREDSYVLAVGEGATCLSV